MDRREEERAKHRMATGPQPGEVQLKAWLAEQAMQRGSNIKAMYYLFSRGRLGESSVRRVNQRVIYVKP